MAVSNRRHFPRKREDAVVQLLIARDPGESQTENIRFIPVKKYNESEEGLYLEVGYALDPGANVCIKMISPDVDSRDEAYRIFYGRVIWCKALDNEKQRFGMGVKIVEKAVQARILSSRF
jgi:hypothetical protein